MLDLILSIVFLLRFQLPPKPQQVIIEKWLPYKTPPPREVIVERVHEDGSAAATAAATATTANNYENFSRHSHRHRRHSAEYQGNSSDSIRRVDSAEHLDQQRAMNEYGWDFYNNQYQHQYQDQNQQMFAYHHEQARAQFEAYQKWMAQQWQRHQNMMMRTFQTPPLVVQHPPVTLTMGNGTVFERREVRKQSLFFNPGQIQRLC